MIYRRVVLDAWMLIESDPSAVTFSERPGTVLIGERNHQVDFSVRYADKAELLIAADSPGDEDADVRDTINTSACVVRRNSVNPEAMYSKKGLIRVDIIKHTRNDLKSSTRISAT